MRYLLLILAVFHINSTIANVTFRFKVKRGDSVSVKYFKPFKGFANRDVGTLYDHYATDEFYFRFDIDKPTFIRFVIDNKDFDFLCEPTDSIAIDIRRNLGKKSNIIKIFGNNKDGHEYYNLVFHRNKMDKFYKIRDLFSEIMRQDSIQIISKLALAFQQQTRWIDSLLSKKQISATFSTYMKTEIHSILAWEVGELCNKYFEHIESERKKSSQIKNGLFKIVNPLDEKLRTCIAATAYYYTYFYELGKSHVNEIDQGEVLVPEEPFFNLAPPEIRGFVVGSSLYVTRKFFPYKYDYCTLFKRYKNLYNDGPFNDYFQGTNACKPVKRHNAEIIEGMDMDIFSFISFKFSAKRVYVDLWATWCVPCKMEFSKHDSVFYKTMDENDVQLLYISIDKPEDESKWREEIEDMNLNGYHVLAGRELRNSLKDVVYEGRLMSVPRYLVFDESGKMISSDFKRPSDPMFKKEIESLLAGESR